MTILNNVNVHDHVVTSVQLHAVARDYIFRLDYKAAECCKIKFLCKLVTSIIFMHLVHCFAHLTLHLKLGLKF